MLPLKVRQELLRNAVSPYAGYCTGYSGQGAYVCALTLAIGSFRDPCGHSGFNVLDSIKAFDMAETEAAYIGQINMVTVSSFCGPEGLIWGHDVAGPVRADLHALATSGEFAGLEILSGRHLTDAAKALFGTANDRRLPLLPGAHVPTAAKTHTVRGPARPYAAFALAVPKSRATAACALVEDVGEIASDDEKQHIAADLVRACLAVGRNNRVEYETIYLDITDREISDEEVGCALVAMPYVKLAGRAHNKRLATYSLDDWERHRQWKD
jgi:histidine decarboxylase